MASHFEWNNDKAKANAYKHGITFEEAQTVFQNPFAVIFEDREIMKKMSARKPRQTKPKAEDDLLPEYRFDYSKAKPNRFAQEIKEGSMIVVLEPEIAAYFKSPEAVNTMLRALIKALPQTTGI